MSNALALVIHFHQPVGNLDAVVRNATDRCYRPFLETLARFEDLKMTLHYSGCLLEWLEANAPDVTDNIRGLSERGQIELLTGGFYEPILAALPHRDQVGQIGMLTEHLATNYGADATGLWLTERVWEQEVVSAITEAGVRYTVLDDTMFHSVGVGDDELTGPFVTDHDGRPLLVYAGDRNLRYLIPYKRVERVSGYLAGGTGDRLFVYADDGEKFGEWPDTYQRVYEDGWLESFFSSLLEGETEVVTLGEHAASARPRGRIYLPSSSYDEMMTWALPAEARLKIGKARRDLRREDPDGILPFVRGAPWRSFLAKYPEVNHLQKRMLFVSNELADAGESGDALKELYRAQCNCAYWHGAFGGVYLAFMRTALWHHLMRAEASVGADAQPSVVVADLDADSRAEVLLSGAWGAAVVSPDEGIVMEVDDWKVGANLLAVAARHREAYHLADENPPEDDDKDDEMSASQARADVEASSLTFDERPLGGLVDLIDGEPITTRFDWSVEDAGVRCEVAERGLAITKTFSVTSEGLGCRIVLSPGTAGFKGAYATETAALPLNLGRDTAEDDLETSHSGWCLTQPEAEVGLAVTIQPPGNTTGEPIQTASTSLEGLQTMFQGTIVTTSWELDLAPGERFEVEQSIAPRHGSATIDKKEPGVSA